MTDTHGDLIVMALLFLIATVALIVLLYYTTRIIGALPETIWDVFSTP